MIKQLITSIEESDKDFMRHLKDLIATLPTTTQEACHNVIKFLIERCQHTTSSTSSHSYHTYKPTYSTYRTYECHDHDDRHDHRRERCDDDFVPGFLPLMREFRKFMDESGGSWEFGAYAKYQPACRDEDKVEVKRTRLAHQTP